MPNPQRSVAIVYPYIPHYRIPVFRELANNSAGWRYVFFSGDNTIDRTIKSSVAGNDLDIEHTRNITVKGLTIQLGLLNAVLGGRFSEFIFLGDAHFVTTWIYALLARMRGKQVYFWTHGWLRRDTGLKRLMRLFFYRLAHGLLLYGDRAVELGRQCGYPVQRMHVIYNSLDYAQQSIMRRTLEDQASAIETNKDETESYFACIARITEQCRFDIAIDALARLRDEHGLLARLVLIGDGPAVPALRQQAELVGVDVQFTGALYEESLIGPILFGARAVVSPGKVGLTAMHALAYGTPVITHSDLEQQGPEVEAIQPDVTGDVFPPGDTAALATLMHKWLQRTRSPHERQACFSTIESRYTPQVQRQLIEQVLQLNHL